jgi:hypothetical protein
MLSKDPINHRVLPLRSFLLASRKLLLSSSKTQIHRVYLHEIPRRKKSDLKEKKSTGVGMVGQGRK